MIPFWFMPYAIACGNTCILKPSEKVPLTLQKVVQLIEQTGLPAGVVNLVNGTKGVVDTLLDHPTVRAISFVGSTPVAKYMYSRAAKNGKRAQCQGGAKNPVIVLPGGYCHHDANYGRQCLWLCRAAMFGGIGGNHGGRSKTAVY